MPKLPRRRAGREEWLGPRNDVCSFNPARWSAAIVVDTMEITGSAARSPTNLPKVRSTRSVRVDGTRLGVASPVAITSRRYPAFITARSLVRRSVGATHLPGRVGRGASGRFLANGGVAQPPPRRRAPPQPCYYPRRFERAYDVLASV